MKRYIFLVLLFLLILTSFSFAFTYPNMDDYPYYIITESSQHTSLFALTSSVQVVEGEYQNSYYSIDGGNFDLVMYRLDDYGSWNYHRSFYSNDVYRDGVIDNFISFSNFDIYYDNGSVFFSPPEQPLLATVEGLENLPKTIGMTAGGILRGAALRTFGAILAVVLIVLLVRRWVY